VASRWPIRLLSAGLAVWYARFGFSSRHRPDDPAHILVAHHLLLGDTIMLTPLLKKLRTSFPRADIVMTCPTAIAPLFAGQPYGVRVVPFDPRQASTFAQLFKNRGFDLALLPADNRFSWLARGLNSRWITAFQGDYPPYKNWLVDEFRPYPNQAMALGDLIADRLVEGPAPDPYEVADWPAPPCAPFIMPPSSYGVLHVGASSRLRHWEAKKWRSLIAHLESSGINPVITVGPGEEGLVAEIDPTSRYLSFPGTLSLAQMWRLLSGALALVCLDSGVSHLARLAGTPSVVLFGPGSATLFGGGDFWRNIPGRKVTIPQFPCRDENRIFRRYLPWAEHCGRSTAQCASPKCMHGVTDEMVVQALDSLLLQISRPTPA
jgi:ADP-heptose:LPS heptosyltransferase